MKVPKEELKQIRKIQAVLHSVKSKNPIFFNIATYEHKLKFVYSRKKWAENAVGNKVEVGHTWHLTAKGLQMLNASYTMV